MIRVAYICADADVPVFGTRRSSLQVQEMVRAFERQGAQVQLFAARLGGTAPPDLAHVRVHALSPLPKAEAAERERAAIRGNQELRWLLGDAGPFTLIYERYSLWSYAGMEAAAAAGVPGLLEVNGALIEEQIEYRVLVDRTAAEQVARRAFKAAGAVIAVSRSLAERIERDYADVSGDVLVVPNGVNLERFPARTQPFAPRRANAFTIGTVAAPDLTVLLEAFVHVKETVPNARLLMIADGARRDACLATIDARGLRTAVDFTPMVAPEDVPELLNRMDVAVATDAGEEYGALLEYMAAGVPLVANREDPFDQLITHGATGVLCERDDVAGLAHALELLAGNPLLRARLGAEGRAHVLRHHTWEEAAGRVLDTAAILSARPAA
jgi:glycosyltransferase involved in cell wall biosynthesis